MKDIVIEMYPNKNEEVFLLATYERCIKNLLCLRFDRTILSVYVFKNRNAQRVYKKK